jgi:hypothetical protein
MSLPVSVLDLVGMRTKEPAGSAIARSVDLARHTEDWGYRRYWLAEHHSIPGLACSATSVLIGHIAAATKTMRVGSGGVMREPTNGIATSFTEAVHETSASLDQSSSLLPESEDSVLLSVRALLLFRLDR